MRIHAWSPLPDTYTSRSVSILHEVGIDSFDEIGYSYTALRMKLVTIAAKESAYLPCPDTWGG